ncbi:MAG: hypothetical protein HYS12_00450 [Planctomycetes bacterium]|nr:hypothetical protein [Planctomycetota bacterium]
MPKLPTKLPVRDLGNLPRDLVATDSEWDTTQQDPWLSTAFATSRGTVVCLRNDLPRGVQSRLDTTACELGVKLLYTVRFDSTNLLDAALPHLMPDAKANDRVRLALFFSPKDVEYVLGWDKFGEAIHSGRVRQRNNLAGRVGRVVLKDLDGWAGKSKLAEFAAALGVPMPDKTSMDDFKKEMRRGLEERPEDFLRYAVDDARVLLEVYARFVAFVRRTLSEILGMAAGDLWRADDIPMTTGRLVAETFERWLFSRTGEHADALRFCARKLGFLDPDADDYLPDRENRHILLDQCRTPEALAATAVDPVGKECLRIYAKSKYLFTALDGCGVRWWASRPTTETAGYNTLVQGGRCHNERPHEYATGPGLDVDIAGCYGTSLRTLTFPIGLPSVWSYHPNEKRPTLGEWLGRFESRLVPGLWTCTVSGSLPFEQDLLYSKLVKARDLRQAAGPDGIDIPTDFVLLRREVKNAILTADLLAALKAVATNSEWAALQKLEVVTACAYLAEDRKGDVGEWCRAVLAASDGGLRARVNAGAAADKRTRAWYGVGLEDFVGRLADERQRVKDRSRDAGPAERGLDQILKLLINTLYGVLASRHFSVGNTVLANNITARARLGVWMVAKALGLRQSITDGGVYTPNAVPHYRGRRPGFDTLPPRGPGTTRDTDGPSLPWRA